MGSASVRGERESETETVRSKRETAGGRTKQSRETEGESETVQNNLYKMIS